MTSFVIDVRFPMGSFLAHGPNGGTEWPPSPARLAMALLATAYRTDQGITSVRSFFSEQPPVIVTPPAGGRDVNTRRWVPVDPQILNREKGRLDRSTKLQKPPERGITVGEGLVRYSFENSQLPTRQIEELADVARKVPYLGRPTSPAVLTLTESQRAEPDVDSYIWTPDPEGVHHLNVATGEFLDELDRREQERRAATVPGHHPRIRRIEHSYRRDTKVDVGGPTQPSRRIAEQLLREMVSCITPPKTTPENVLSVVSALGLTNDDLVIPIYDESRKRGVSTPRLRSVLISGPSISHGAQDPLIIDGQVHELTYSLAPAGRRERQAVGRVWSTSSAWTTLLPVTATRNELIAEIDRLADRVGIFPAEATTHSEPRDPLAPAVDYNPQYTYVSLLWNQPVTGPLRLAAGALVPIETQLPQNGEER